MDNYVSFRREFGLIVVGAIIFTASFMWKDLLNDIEEIYFPKAYGLKGRILFTLLITILLVCCAVHLKVFLGLGEEIQNKQQKIIQFDDSPLDNGSTDSSE